jgi:ribonuclease Z
MSLTLADGGKKAFSFYGPPSMDRFWASTRRFMYRPDLSVSIYDATTSGPVRCKESTIHPVPFENKSSIGISSRFYLSYICETPPKAGKFDVARAAALGVPKGPLFAKLKCGEDVTLPDGLVVRSIDVVEQADPGRCCAIVAAVDLSGVGESPLEDFCNLPQWKRCAADPPDLYNFSFS